VRRLSRRSSKLSNFSTKNTQRRDGRVTFGTCVADSSGYIEHIINPLQHYIKVVIRLKPEDSMKQINEFQHMEAGSTEVSNQ
jgi:hypothetical protein